MRILVTNDDGIDAPGLRVLAAALRPLGEVVVVAPERERSAVSHAITMYDPLRAWRADFDGCIAWAVSGMPADCVLLAVRELLAAPPDVVASGINRGANLGEDVWYSGTVSAAMEGAVVGVPSIAVSTAAMGPTDHWDYRAAAEWAQRLVPLAAERLAPGTILNVNVPNLPPEQIAGARLCRQGRRAYGGAYDKRQDPRGGTYYWLGSDLPRDEPADGTDVTALYARQVAITPVSLDLTDYRALGELAAWIPTGL